MDPVEHRHVVLQWAEHVRSNAQAARTMRQHLVAFPQQTCYHAHLAVEQALKTVLVLRLIDPPKSHDLIRLVALLPQADQQSLPAVSWADLGRWAIQDRYPLSGPEARIQDADTALQIMEILVDWLKALLSKEQIHITFS